MEEEEESEGCANRGVGWQGSMLVMEEAPSDDVESCGTKRQRALWVPDSGRRTPA